MDEKSLRAKLKSEMKEVTLEQLPKYIEDTLALVDVNNMDEAYGAICIAIGGLAATTAWAINKSDKGGISGFQAGCIMWEFLDMFNHIEAPARILQIKDMLYPQYADKFTAIDKETFEFLQKEAATALEENPDSHEKVTAHWNSIISGTVPFGYKITE